jgi:hypothetical protein
MIWRGRWLLLSRWRGMRNPEAAGEEVMRNDDMTKVIFS